LQAPATTAEALSAADDGLLARGRGSAAERAGLPFRWLLCSVVLLGVGLRALVFAADKSFTLDEAFIALNAARHSWRGLLGQLDWNSAAPAAFLWSEKALYELKPVEHVLRAPSLLASVLALVLFVPLALRTLARDGALLAVSLFAAMPLAITYAALVKPYSLDLLFVIAVSLATLGALSRPTTARLVWLAGLGAIAPAFSYGSIFAVAACATVIIVRAVKGHKSSRGLAMVVCVWAVLLLTWYVWRGGTLSGIQSSFTNEYLNSLSAIRDAAGAAWIVLGISSHTAKLGQPVAAVAITVSAAFFLVGAVTLARRRWEAAGVVLLPLIYGVIASVAQLYPLTPRTMLFMAPGLVLCIANGVWYAFARARGVVVPLVVAALVGVVLVSEASAATRALAPIRRDEGIKPMLQVLSARERPSDTTYVTYAAQYPLALYLDCDCAGRSFNRLARRGDWRLAPISGGIGQWSPALRSKSSNIVIGKFRGYGLSGFYRDFAMLRGRGRVWILLSFAHPSARRALIERLNNLGRPIASFGSGSGVDATTLYLYSFRSPTTGK
jgi:hypothetical protein